MDVLAHALWTHAIHRGVAKAKNIKLNKKAIWTVIFFGLAPDLFSFGPFFVKEIFFHGTKIFGGGPPDPASIPAYIYNSYNYTHSFVLFLTIFAVVWALRGKPFWLMYGWGLHILIDMFSHSKSFFPTPFLFPLSSFKINGWSWGDPTFMFINYSLLALTYIGLYIYSKRKRATPII
ncbi:MAG: hypothetical protein AAB787_02510 [Patescibacteria group bacterium]